MSIRALYVMKWQGSDDEDERTESKSDQKDKAELHSELDIKDEPYSDVEVISSDDDGNC